MPKKATGKKTLRPRVCIVITDWNNGDVIFDCLRTLIKVTKYNNYRIVIVDNASSDGSPDKIRREFGKTGKVFVVDGGSNLGFTKGTNLGWTYSFKNLNPDYILDLNADTLHVQPDWLDLMVDELEKDEKRAICGNKLVYPDGRLQLLYTDRNATDFQEKDKGQYDFVKEVSGVGGANMLIKAAMIRKFGALDENFFYGPDDVDFCFRAKKAGWKVVYQGLSKTIHLGSFTYQSNKEFLYRPQSYALMIFTFRHENLISGVKMVLNQFFRAFFTREDLTKKARLGNLHFHRTFPKRLYFALTSFMGALANYRKVKNNYFKLK